MKRLSFSVVSADFQLLFFMNSGKPKYLSTQNVNISIEESPEMKLNKTRLHDTNPPLISQWFVKDWSLNCQAPK